jgi:hypothetical protein
MKTTIIFHDLKKCHRRIGLVIAAIVLAYLLLEVSPRILEKGRFVLVSFSAFGLEGNTLVGCLQLIGGALLALLIQLFSIAILLGSIAIAWAGFCRSKKKAYVFFLMYLLFPMVLTLGSRTFRTDSDVREHAEHHARQEDTPHQFEAPSPQIPPPMQMNVSLALPVGPLLFLAGLWCFYGKEMTDKSNGISEAERGPT